MQVTWISAVAINNFLEWWISISSDILRSTA